MSDVESDDSCSIKTLESDEEDNHTEEFDDRASMSRRDIVFNENIVDNVVKMKSNLGTKVKKQNYYNDHRLSHAVSTGDLLHNGRKPP